jgi:hypothetical protein
MKQEDLTHAADPAAFTANVPAGRPEPYPGGDHHGPMTSVRTATYRGRLVCHVNQRLQTKGDRRHCEHDQSMARSLPGAWPQLNGQNISWAENVRAKLANHQLAVGGSVTTLSRDQGYAVAVSLAPPPQPPTGRGFPAPPQEAPNSLMARISTCSYRFSWQDGRP